MKICVFTDIHGNLDALKQLVKSEDFLNADKRICLGDTVGVGPYSLECVKLLENFEYIYINGNHESKLTSGIESYKYRDEKLLYECKQIIKQCKKDFSLTLNNKKLYFTHYVQNNNSFEAILKEVNSLNLDEKFINIDADIIFYGHEHNPSDFEGNKRYVDVGSLGLKNEANYVMVNTDNEEIVIEHKSFINNIPKLIEDAKGIKGVDYEVLSRYNFSNTTYMKYRTVLITGGAGFLGSNLCFRMLSSPFNIIVVDDLKNCNLDALRRVEETVLKKIKFIKGDLTNNEFVKQIFEENNIDIVVHFAAKKYTDESSDNSQEYLNNNINSTKNILKYAQTHNIEELYFASSIAVYGANEKNTVLKEDMPLNPQSPYAKSKAICEGLFEQYSKNNSQAKVVVFRFSNPIGANDIVFLGDNPSCGKKNIVSYLVEQISNGNCIMFNGNNHKTKDGTSERDYVDIKDLINIVVKVIEFNKSKGYFIYNVGGGKSISGLEIAKCISNCLGKSLSVGYNLYRLNEPDYIKCDISRIKNDYGYNPLCTLKDMVSESVKFYDFIINDKQAITKD